MEKKIKYLGIDIGGAHLKIVGLNFKKEIIIVTKKKCPIWKGINYLDREIEELNQLGNKNTICGITMTAELCDNFKGRKDGVKKIINSTKNLNFKKLFFTNDEYNQFKKKPNHSEVSSMNWLATAKFVSKKINNGLIIDFGSTTTDLILIENKKIKNKYYNDLDRIINSELIYSGFTRTPLAGIANEVKYNNRKYSLIPEFFSNTADMYRIIQNSSENLDLYNTADGRSKSKKNSYKRVARNFGFDLDRSNKKLVLNLCKLLSNYQLKKILLSVKKILISNNIKKNNISLIFCGIGKDVLENYFKSKGYNYRKLEDLVVGSLKKRTRSAYHAPAASCAFLLSYIK